MEKVVNGGEKLTNDHQVVNRKRKKRKKQLDQLRKNVLEAKRKLRDETAPPKPHVSTFNKILNNFADQRQKNDNKNQGFDDKGRRAGVKRMCNRLLPSRKPQVGIFANGSKGAEIKRGNPELNEIDMARFEGDLQKVLCNGMQKKPKTRETSASEALIKYLNKPPLASHTAVCEEEPKIANFERLGQVKIEPEIHYEYERQNAGKRKPETSDESDDESVKKVLLPVATKKSDEKRATVDVECNNNFVESEKKKTGYLVEEKGKRCLFRNVEEAEPEPGSIRDRDTRFEELRFSPRIGRPKVKTNSTKRAMPFAVSVPESEKNTPIENDNRALFKHTKLGRMVATRYGELCGMVCAENFENCLRNIPHVDPLKKVKKSLIDCYVAAQRHNRLNFEKERAATVTSGSVERRPVGCSHLEKTAETFLDRSVPPRRKVTAAETMRVEDIKRNKNVFQGNNTARKACHPPYSPEKTFPEVNYERSLANFGESPGYSKTREMERNFPTVTEIPTDRRKIMLRYLKELRSSAKSEGNEVLKSPIFPPGVSVAPLSDSNIEIQKRYLGDPLRRHQMIGVKKDKSFTPVSLEKKSNSSDVSRDSGGTRLKLDLGGQAKIERRAGILEIPNLESASPSFTLQIPSNRDKMPAQYIRGLKKANEVFSPDLLPKFAGDVGNNPKRDSIGNRQRKMFPMCRAVKAEKHVPAILRKPQPNNVKNFTKETPGDNFTLTARDALRGIRKWSPNQKSPIFEKKLSEALFSKNQESFPNVIRNSDRSECPDIPTKISQGGTFAVLQEPQLQTPTVINGIFDRTEGILKAKRNFMNAKSRQVVPNGEPNAGIRAPNFLGQNARQEIRPVRDSENPLNFMDAATLHKITAEREKALAMSGAPDEECQRFPIYLKRKNKLPTGGHQDKRYSEECVQGQAPAAFQGNGSQTKVIIIHNPNLLKRSDPRDRHRQICENKNFSGRGLETAEIIPLHLHQVRDIRQQQTSQQQFQIPEVYPYHGNSECPQEAARYSYPNTTTDVQLQPRIVYRQDAGRIYGSVNLRDNPGFPNRFQHVIPQPNHRGSFDVSTSQKINSQFPHTAPAVSAVQIPATFVSAHCAGGNLNPKIETTTITEPKPVQLMDGRIGFILQTNNEHNSWYQNPSQLQWNGVMIEDDKKCSYSYHIDPRCPQAEYQRNLQFNETVGQVRQHVIQPNYNVTDVYNHPGTTHQRSAPLCDHCSTKP
ncbi:uncharacterized protein LOC105685738 [Athalia rosae]|uniref:uncharacterized protein LOC105685738 n=1 Tax=Athalia rosae TaxID=37344 RepID=UPI0020348344|nr:uncharacterized protein LOC105685738 [Athalia rosae]